MGRKDIGNIVEIMKKDFKSAFSNPIVTIILIGIIILPSLYALLNIYLHEQQSPSMILL